MYTRAGSHTEVGAYSEVGTDLVLYGTYIYREREVVDQNFFLNRTLVIDSPFQTFAVGLLVEIIDYPLPLLFSRNAFLVE